MAMSQHWPLPAWGFPGYKALAGQHSQTLTSLSFLCSPDEDSCQKFVPFVGVSALRDQQAIWAGMERGNTALLMLGFMTCLSLQVVKVGLVEQSFNASGESLTAHSPWLPSLLWGGPCWCP